MLAGAAPVLVHNCGDGSGADGATQQASKSEAKPIHLALGLTFDSRSGTRLDIFAAEHGAVTWKDQRFSDLFPGGVASDSSLETMMQRVLDSGGRISFNLGGMQNLPGVLEGTVGAGLRTSFELRHVCGNSAIRSIATFHNGSAPC